MLIISVRQNAFWPSRNAKRNSDSYQCLSASVIKLNFVVNQCWWVPVIKLHFDGYQCYSLSTINVVSCRHIGYVLNAINVDSCRHISYVLTAINVISRRHISYVLTAIKVYFAVLKNADFLERQNFLLLFIFIDAHLCFYSCGTNFFIF